MQIDYHIDDDEAKAKCETAHDRLARIGHLIGSSDSRSIAPNRYLGRNLWTRFLDAVLAGLRSYAPPIHRVLSALTAAVLCIYIRLVALTSHLIATGQQRWPDVPAPCVIALWHRDAPSLLVAFAKRRPRSQSVIMIARDARGDVLALLCRMLGFSVVRGGTNGGWNALSGLAGKLEAGACVFITADGGGPSRVAKVGSVALAFAANVPLVPLVANCHPAIEERHKWDAARNPIPFSSVTVSSGPTRSFAEFTDLSSIEQARNWLQRALNELETKDV